MEHTSTTNYIIYISAFALLLFVLHLADDIKREEILQQFGSDGMGVVYYGTIFVVWVIGLVLIYKNKVKAGLWVAMVTSAITGFPTLMIHTLGTGEYSFVKIADKSGFIFAFVALLLALASLGIFILSIICIINRRRKRKLQ